jgi:hypothetical protein
MGQGVGFSRSGASDDEKRRSDRAVSSNAMFDRSALLRIETRLPTRIALNLELAISCGRAMSDCVHAAKVPLRGLG